MEPDVFWVGDYYENVGKSRAEFIEELITQFKIAESYNFKTAWIAEHHFSNYGTIPSTSVFLSSIARETKRIRLGTAIVTIVFRNPVQVAEEFSLLDILSKGRLDLGVGSGYLKHEFEGFNVPQEWKREIFDEALEIILKAFTGEKFSYKGKHFNLNDILINVTPYQIPHPPIWVGVLRADASFHVGKKGFNILMIPYATVDKIEELSDVVSVYRRANPKGKVAIAFHAHVGKNNHEAIDESKEYLTRYVFSRLYAKKRTLEELYSKGLYIVGGPEEVAKQIEYVYNVSKPDKLMFLLNFGMMPNLLIEKSMELLSEKVSKLLYQKGISIEFDN